MGNLKGNTKVYEEQIPLIELTGHRIHILGKIRATIILGNREVRHTMYVVKDDFPIDYKGILGIDFLKKQHAKCDHGRQQLHIGKITFKLYPYKKVTLKLCSETIESSYETQ